MLIAAASASKRQPASIPSVHVVDPAIVLVALVPVIAVMAYIGGVSHNHPKRRLVLGVGAALSVLWVAFLLLQITVSS